MVDVLQASIKAAAISGIFFIWANYTIEAFKFVRHIVSTSPEEKTWNPITKPCVEIAKNFMMMMSIT